MASPLPPCIQLANNGESLIINPTGGFASGSFQPTWTNGLGFTGTASGTLYWSQTGNIVQCMVNLTGATAASGPNNATITLPIARSTAFSNTTQACGTVTGLNTTAEATYSGYVLATSAPNTVLIELIAGASNAVTLFCIFAYSLI
jgi:hypothetical protein